MKSGPIKESSITLSDTDNIDPKAVQQAIRAHAEDIKRRELRQAFTQLEACGPLTPEQRRIITRMATAITDDILSAPESILADVSENDCETVLTTEELFDPDRGNTT